MEKTILNPSTRESLAMALQFLLEHKRYAVTVSATKFPVKEGAEQVHDGLLIQMPDVTTSAARSEKGQKIANYLATLGIFTDELVDYTRGVSGMRQEQIIFPLAMSEHAALRHVLTEIDKELHRQPWDKREGIHALAKHEGIELEPYKPQPESPKESPFPGRHLFADKIAAQKAKSQEASKGKHT